MAVPTRAAERFAQQRSHLAWSAARLAPNAYETAAYDAFKLGTDQGTDFTVTVYTLRSPRLRGRLRRCVAR